MNLGKLGKSIGPKRRKKKCAVGGYGRLGEG